MNTNQEPRTENREERLSLSDSPTRSLLTTTLDRNLLVEAGAGSGKTHEMARRMAAGIAAGVYVLEGMAAVTFTRKAAAELRGRFQMALDDLIAERDGRVLEEDARARVRAALSNLERFFAGTIHAFCAHLLRERPVEAGVAPGFTELDEIEDLVRRRQSWRDYVSQQLGAGDPTLLELKAAGVKPSDLDQGFGIVTLHEDVDFPPGDGQVPDAEAAGAALDAFWATLEAMLPDPIAPGTTCRTQKAAREFRRRRRVARHAGGDPAALAGLLQTWNFEPDVTQKWWAGDTAGRRRAKEAVCTLHGAFRETTVRPFLQAWRQYVYRLGVTLLIDAREFAARERRRLNVLNYTDLLQLTVRVLRGNAEVRSALQQKYRWLFVDEFQDTDPAQAEILFRLASRDGDGEADWRTLPLRPGALFVVGDPKQSIYRFRRADIDIYNTVRMRFEADGGGTSSHPSRDLAVLTTNFRSEPELCEWANSVFVQAFPPAPTPYSPQFAPLAPASRRPGGSTHPHRGVFKLTIPTEVESRAVNADEADRIARYIRAEVDAGRRTCGDFLVLTRRKRELASYAAALEALEIPVDVSGAGAFRHSAEVARLALLLRALSDPQDVVSLVGVLRGPLFGISDRALFEWRQAGGVFTLFGGDEAGGADDPRSGSPVLDGLETLRQYSRWVRLLPAAPAIERILEHSGYLALAAASHGGADAGDLLQAVDRVRQIVADGQTLAAAAGALEADLESHSEVESLPLEPGRTDVVRVMNLHKAKGLEAAVVFLADPCGGFSPRVDVRVVRTGARAEGYFRLMRTFENGGHQELGAPAGWAGLEAEELRYLQAEGTRLLYVAATRAREALIVGGWGRAGTGDRRAWGALDPFLASAPELPVPASVAVPARAAADMSPDARAAAEETRRIAHERARSASWSVASVTAEARHAARLTRGAEPAADDPTRVVVRNSPSHRADAGMAWGTLVHGLLEHAMRHESATADDLRRLALWLTVEQPQLREVIDEAVATVQSVARASFWEEAQAAEHAVEAPFAHADRDGNVMTGVMDLLFRGPAAWQVIDYKTDVAVDAAAAARYAAQLESYRRALKACGLSAAEARMVPVRGPGDTDAPA